MGKITKNLSRHEFACECECGFDVVDVELVKLLQDAVDTFARRYNAERAVITITGPNRCKEHNAAIGGAEKSQHIYGKAADHNIEIWPKSGAHFRVSTDDLADYYNDRHPARLGVGRYAAGRVHLDVRDSAARWDAR